MNVADLTAGHLLDAGAIGQFRIVHVDPPDDCDSGLASRWQVCVQACEGARTGEPDMTIAAAAGAEFVACESIRADRWAFYYPDGADVKVAS